MLRHHLQIVLRKQLLAAVAVFFAAAAYGQTNAYWTSLAFYPDPNDSLYRIDIFRPRHGEDGARLWSQTKSMFVYGIGVIAVIYALPEESTGWDRDAEVFGKWFENVRAGPEWDRNDWAYNYLGHTYFGGVYYQVARKSGYRQWDSACYAFLMSTFYWEYGIEAFAEVPSVQDLVSTPILGWLYGEWAYRTEIRIRDNQNSILGSRILGNGALFLLDPVDALGSGVNRITGRQMIKAGYGYFSYTAAPSGNETDHRLYLNMDFPIGGASDFEHHEARYEIRDEPVDTGIIGVAIGTGRAVLDDAWGIEGDDYTKVSLGLYFTPRWSSRLSYAWGDAVESATGESISYENYSLDVQRYFLEEGVIRPYVSAGIGEQMFEEDLGPSAVQLNAGLGVHVKLHRKLSLQMDWTHYRGTHTSDHDQQVNAALVYRFGDGENAAW